VQAKDDTYRHFSLKGAAPDRAGLIAPLLDSFDSCRHELRIAIDYKEESKLRALVVILLPKVRDEILAHHPAQGVLELHRLNK